MNKGLFITFEGIEGSGKSTQAIQLAEHLKERGYSVVVTREPGGTPIGVAIRQILLDPAINDMDYHTEVLLYAADRAQHVAEVIRPSLEKGKIVISDRYIDSSIAYQHFGRGLPLDLIIEINERAVQGLKPNVTFLLEIPVELGIERATKVSADRIERESIEFHKRVEAGYQELARREPERWRVIDGIPMVEEVHQSIVRALEVFL
ncbi:MAG: dTMP kinase [Actinomycetota bacterium]|nr:dTMP kinase [Actinomycetota bacterium]